MGGGSARNVRVGDCALNRCGNKSWRRRIVVPFSSREINAPRERGARYGLRAIPTARDLHVRTANPFVVINRSISCTKDEVKWATSVFISFFFYHAQNSFQAYSCGRACKIVIDAKENPYVDFRLQE